MRQTWLLLLLGAVWPATADASPNGIAMRVAEAERLVFRVSEVLERLPAGSHRAKDDLRALRGKLQGLLQVASETTPSEWDSMIEALLSADYYGVDDIMELLKGADDGASTSFSKLARSSDSAEDCDDDGAMQSVDAGIGRRLQQDQQGSQDSDKSQLPNQLRRPLPSQPSQPFQPSQPSAPVPVVFEPTVGVDPPSAARLASIGWDLDTWRSWLLDRPPPWERDCDCCFDRCPVEHNCLLQTDGLYLACRGESLGEFLANLWDQWCARCLAVLVGFAADCLHPGLSPAHRPLSVVLVTLLSVAVTFWWIREQAQVFIHHANKVKRYNDEDEGDRHEDEDEDDQDDEDDSGSDDSSSDRRDVVK